MKRAEELRPATAAASGAGRRFPAPRLVRCLARLQARPEGRTTNSRKRNLGAVRRYYSSMVWPESLPRVRPVWLPSVTLNDVVSRLGLSSVPTCLGTAAPRCGMRRHPAVDREIVRRGACVGEGLVRGVLAHNSRAPISHARVSRVLGVTSSVARGRYSLVSRKDEKEFGDRDG